MRLMKSSFLALALCATALAPRPALAASPLAGVLVENGRALFYQVPADALKAARKSFVVRVSLDGRPFTEETFHLKEGVAAAPTVELFALSSRLRDQVFEKASRPDHFVTVAVLLDGRAVTELAWDDFVRSSLQLRNEGSFQPVAVASEVKSFDSPRAGRPGARGTKPLPAKGVYTEPYCAERCQQDLDSCLEWCDPRGDSCTLCYTWYNDCFIQCPTVCEDPKEVKTYTTQTAVGYQYTGVGGCYQSLFGGSFNYWQTQNTIKNTQYRKTTYCNGTSTTEEVSYWYTYLYCFQKGASCPLPYSGTMYQSCSN